MPHNSYRPDDKTITTHRGWPGSGWEALRIVRYGSCSLSGERGHVPPAMAGQGVATFPGEANHIFWCEIRVPGSREVCVLYCGQEVNQRGVDLALFDRNWLAQLQVGCHLQK